MREFICLKCRTVVLSGPEPSTCCEEARVPFNRDYVRREDTRD